MQHPPITFRTLLYGLRDALGEVHLPLDQQATEPCALIASSALHLTLARDTARRIYKANGCRHLGSPIDADLTLDTLGRLRNTLAHASACDVDQMRFIDDLAGATVNLLDITAEPAT